MMEKVSNRVDIRLVTNSKGCLTLAWRPSYISKKVFNDKVKNNLTINDSTHIEYLHYIFTRPECMIFIITILKVNITIKLDYPLLMQWTMMSDCQNAWSNKMNTNCWVCEIKIKRCIRLFKMMLINIKKSKESIKILSRK